MALTDEQREALKVIQPFYCFVPLLGDLFVSIKANGDAHQYYWPDPADGFIEVTAEEGFRRALEQLHE